MSTQSLYNILSSFWIYSLSLLFSAQPLIIPRAGKAGRESPIYHGNPRSEHILPARGWNPFYGEWDELMDEV